MRAGAKGRRQESRAGGQAIRSAEGGTRFQTVLSADQRTLTVHVPLKLHKRGGRKLVVGPDGVIGLPRRPRTNNALVKALVRAHRWQHLLENGTYASVAEIAAAEKINDSYLGRVLRLTLLAPEIVENILDGRQPAEMTLAKLTRPFPVGWAQQKQ